jgi:predicted nucleic acid-binding Zn ribbon protein
VTQRRREPRRFELALREAQRGWAPDTLLGEIQQAWPAVVGSTIAAHATPSKERGGVLTVSCGASVWAQELDLMSTVILERLNGCISGRIERMRCVALPLQGAT